MTKKQVYDTQRIPVRGSIDDLINELRSYNQADWDGLDVSTDEWGEAELHLYKKRLETDEEYEKRITKEKNKEREIDLREYERLKKKHGW